MLTSRQIGIVQLLHDQEEYTTMNRIAEWVGVSAKTVRNDLQAIREYCLNQQNGSVEAKPHAGVRIIFSEEEWEIFARDTRSDTMDDSLKASIEYTAIRLLLKRGAVSFSELEKRLFIGRSAIEKALPGVKTWFQSHNILYEKKRGKGMEISCTEFNWRMGMWSLCSLRCDTNLPEDVIRAKLLEGFDVYGVEKAVAALEENSDMIFGYESHQRMVFLLSIGIIRGRRRHVVEMPQTEDCKVDSIYDIAIAKRLTVALEQYYQMACDEQERSYILFVVRISDLQRFVTQKARQEFQMQNLELCFFTMKLMNLMGEIINIDLKSDLFFTESLLIQLRSTIQRLKYHISWPHPLLKQVKQKYSNIFAAVYAAGVFFDKELGVEINENEMCSLALLLGGALERNIAVLTACVVCNYGLGVSQLLKEKIERNITDLRILEVLSARDMRKIRNLSCDLVISTLEIPESCGDKEVVVVEHLLPAYDVKKISNIMKLIRKRKLKNKININSVELQKELFHHEFIWLGLEAENKESIIRMMCKALGDAGYVTDGFEQSVFEHEEKAPTELGSGVAIPHGFAKYVIRPVVAFASLKSPIRWQEEEAADLIFMLAFNLDEASGLKEETIKFYSVFLDLLDNEEELEAVRAMDDAEDVTEYMNQKVRGEIKL